MSVKVGRVFYSRYKNARPLQEFLRFNSSKEPCSSKSSEVKDTKEVTEESSCSQSQRPAPYCPTPPPCSGPPPCPPRLTNVIKESGHPCDYVPPVNRDPDYPDMTRIKKLQCKFQEGEQEFPVFLRGGPFSVFLYYLTLFITILSLIMCMQMGRELRKK